MYKETRALVDALNFIYEVCDNIQDHDRCDDCPLRYRCLDDSETSVSEIYDVSGSTWDEFLDYGDNVAFKEEDLESQWADRERKADIEQRMIDEENYGD